MQKHFRGYRRIGRQGLRDFFTVFVALAVLAFEPMALSADAPSPAAIDAPASVAPIVRAIEVDWPGASTALKKKLVAHMHTRIGERYSEQTLEEDIRSVFYGIAYNGGGRIWGEPVAEGVKIVITVRFLK